LILDVLTIGADSSADQFALAADALASAKRVVVLENSLSLRIARNELQCQVVDSTPSAHRCAYEYEVLVENARRLLESSRLHELLPPLPRRWSVVEGHETGATEVWRAP
jgi:hypothetical protein